jgi:transcriptional regulator with XRE-family HTH domain
VVFLFGCCETTLEMGGDDLGKSFGLVVRRHRLNSNLTQEGLAEIAGLHPTYISMVERAARRPTLQVCAKLALALNVELSALIQEASALAAEGHTKR